MNVSQRQRRSVALQNLIGDLRGWHFELECKTCRRGRRRMPTTHLPPYRTVAEVMDRLVCQDCGQPPGWAAITNGLGGRRGWTVTLKGPGALA